MTLQTPEGTSIAAAAGKRIAPADLKSGPNGDFWEDDWDYQSPVPEGLLANSSKGFSLLLTGPAGEGKVNWSFGATQAAAAAADGYVVYLGSILSGLCLAQATAWQEGSFAGEHHGTQAMYNSVGPSPILRMDAIEKHYAGITVLGGVTFDLRAGEVHCLCGENGAGKSTSIKIMAGSVRHDGGTITLDGETVQLASPQDGLRRGIGVVYQELELIPNLSIMENLVLGREPRTAFGTVAWTQVRREAEAVLAMMRVNLRVDLSVSTLTIAQAQLVAIAKILALKPRILVLGRAHGCAVRRRT